MHNSYCESGNEVTLSQLEFVLFQVSDCFRFLVTYTILEDLSLRNLTCHGSCDFIIQNDR